MNGDRPRGIVGIPDALAGQLKFGLNENTGFALPFQAGGLSQWNVVLDPTWTTWDLQALLGFFAPAATPGDIEIDWAWNASEVGSAFTTAGSDAGITTVAHADQVLGQLVSVTLASGIDVIPGAFVTVTADRSGLAGDTAVYNAGTFAFFALVAQRAS